MNGESSSNNSSSKKRSKQLIQCRACNCFILAKDIDKHQILNEPSSTTNNLDVSSSIQLETPKLSTQKRLNNGRNKRPSSTGNFNCNNSGFISSQVTLIEPGNGVVLRKLNNIKEEWDKHFPIELYGWQRKHSALVNPEVLTTLCVPPRSAFLIIPENDTLLATELFLLWPCAELPLMNIAFPPLPYGEEIFNSSLTRLQFINSFGQPLTKILLKPDLTINETITLQEWLKIEKLDYFPYFIKCYFGNALLPISSSKLIKILYYGRQLNFKIISIEEEKEMEIEEIKTKMESLCKVEEVTEINNKSSLYYPTIHRISNSCKFKIDWSEVLQLVAEKDDPDCLL